MMRIFILSCLVLYFSTLAHAKDSTFEIFILENSNKSISFNEILKSNQFKRIKDNATLNFGITNATHWLKIKVKNLDSTQACVLHIETTTPDSI